MSEDKKPKGDLEESAAVQTDEDGKPVFEFEVTQNAETDAIPDDDGLHQAMETEDDG